MLIDLRSDTVTKPCDNMRAAMAKAEIGDDVYGDDSSVNRLQEMICEMTGKQAALFMPSGTQANLIAVMTHCKRGESFVVGQSAHIFQYEAGGTAVLGGLLPYAIENESNGTIKLEKIKKSIKPKDIHFSPVSLICLENTFNGKVIDLDYQNEIAQFAGDKKLMMHLDGARLFNASVATKQSIEALTKPYDSVSICLSKGLGAPVGSLLCGSNEYIEEARHWRKMLGGGLRQSGILAAAGIYALENNIERLNDDHELAEYLAAELKNLGIKIKDNRAHTNMIFIEDKEEILINLNKWMKSKNILLSYSGQGESMRIVIHKDIIKDDIQILLDNWKMFLNANQ